MKVRDEIVSFGAPGELRVDASGVVGGGTRLAPTELNALVAERGEDVVFFDGRNKFEAEIGHFQNAVVPYVANTREFVAELDSGKYDHLKGKPVVTYCTGGIRREVRSGLMKSRGFGEVYQLDGGIVRYGEAYGNEGLWSGSLYVFGNRRSVDFAEDPAELGSCHQCATPGTNMLNCGDVSCREQLVACSNCVALAAPTCAAHAGLPSPGLTYPTIGQRILPGKSDANWRCSAVQKRRDTLRRGRCAAAALGYALS